MSLFPDALDVGVEAFTMLDLSLDILQPNIYASFSTQLSVTVSGSMSLMALGGEVTHFTIYLVLSEDDNYDPDTDATVLMEDLDFDTKTALQVEDGISK